MKLQWVVVEHERVRDVFVDGRRWAVTNRIFLVGEGTHRFDLGAPHDYEPAKRTATVKQTSAQSPLRLAFTALP
jgi:hypothetical protein